MSLRFNTKKLLITLFSLSILLLLSHLIIALIYQGNTLTNSVSLTEAQVDKTFKESLYSFAIKDEWIKKIQNNNSVPTYRIRVPLDLPIAQIISELTKKFGNYGLTISSEEKSINGRTLLQVLSENECRFKGDFRYDSGIQRSESKSALFIYGRENNEAEYDSLIYNSTRDYSALLVPSKSSSMFTKWLKENGFEYAVWLKDDINSIEYKLEKGYSENRTKLIIQNLVVSFPNASFFVLEKKSNIYKSPNYKIIEKEFEKRKINFFSDDYLRFVRGDPSTLVVRFNTILKNAKKDDEPRVALSYEDYQTLAGEIKKLVRVGYKFVKNSELENN